MYRNVIYLIGVLELSFLQSVSFSQELKLVLPIGHTGFVTSGQFSPDGRKVVTTSSDVTAKIWDVALGKLLVNLKAHGSRVNTAQFNQDGLQLVTTSNDNTAIVWNANTGKEVAVLMHRAPVTFAQFSPDGKKIITSSVDNLAFIWNAQFGNPVSGEPPFPELFLTGHTDKVGMVIYSPDGSKIATASDDKTAKIWDAVSGDLVYTLASHSAGVTSVQFSKDGLKIVTTSGDKTCKIWDAVSGSLLATSKGHKGLVAAADFSPDGKLIVSVSADSTCKLWDATTGVLLKSLKNSTKKSSGRLDKKENQSVHFSPPCPDDPEGGRWVLVAAVDNRTDIWETNTGQLKWSLQGHLDYVNEASFSPDGKKIITSSDDGTAKIWDLVTGELLHDLKGHTNELTEAVLNPAGDKLIATYAEWLMHEPTAKVWDINSGEIVKVISGHKDKIKQALFSPDGNKIITASQDGTAKIWDTKNGELLTTCKGHRAWVNTAQFSPDEKTILTASSDGTAKLWDATTGKLLADLKGHTDEVIAANFSNDGRKIVTNSWDRSCKLWDGNTGKLLFTLQNKQDGIFFSQFSPDGKQLLTYTSFQIGGNDFTVSVWNTDSGQLLFRLSGHTELVATAVFSPDGKKIVTSSPDGTTKIWNAANGQLLMNITNDGGMYPFARFNADGKLLVTNTGYTGLILWDATSGNRIREFTGHTEIVNNALFTTDGNYLISYSRDNTMKKWNLTTGECIFTFFGIDSADYFVQIPSGYYKGTPGAARQLHYVTNDLHVIGFDQLDVKYNRPDLVLERSGITDTSMINTYRNAYYKRIKKLGIDTTAFRDGYSVPEMDITNRESFNQLYDQGGLEKILLHIKGVDKTYELDRYNVWVNEVPVFGAKGESIRDQHSKSIDVTLMVTLSMGQNRIEASVTNANGTESYRVPLIVTYAPAIKETETTYFIGIGIDHFKDAAYNLQYSTKDIRDLAVKMKVKYANNIVIDTLFNENVTIDKVKALREQLLQTSVNDRVIISYSGHGLLSKSYDYYLSTYEVDFKNPAVNGLSYDELERLMDSIPARKKLMLIDACHSGEVDKEDYQHASINKEALAANHVVSRGVIVTNTKQDTKKLGLQNSFELMQNLFVNVGRSTGATIISAAAGTELALEFGKLKNGVFTYSIIDAMDKYPDMKVSELKKIVSKKVEELTKGMQKPTSRNEAITVDWRIW